MALPEERVWARGRRSAGEPAVIEGTRVSWGAVWSGLLVGLGVLMLLSTLGLAIGVSAADLGTGEGAGARGLGIGAGIWAGLSLLIALFIGGMVAARMGWITDRPTALLQGALVWVLAMLGIIYLTASGISLGASAVSGIVGGVARGAGAAISGGAASFSELATGDVDQILTRLSDPKTAATVAAATGMSQDEARSALADLHQRVQAARDNPAQAVAAAREGVQQFASRALARAQSATQAAQPYAARTGWVAFLAMALSLVAALLGAVWGSRQAAARLSAV